MKVSLIISTYNWPEALDLILRSLQRQEILPCEVIIADDGSADATKNCIDYYRGKIPVPIVHVWQEDMGNRKSKILNKAVARAKGDYIIQIDGDIIMHRSFVKDHQTLAEKNCYLYGSRVNIRKKALAELFRKKQLDFNFFSKGIKKRSRTFYCPFLAAQMKKHRHYSPKMRGCNLSFWKSDFLAINGYNEEFEGWGKEDSDLVIRMHNNGVWAKRLKFSAIVYHIYHQEQSKVRLENNIKLQELSEHQNVTSIEKGVNQYL